jgi:PASTA domain
MAQSFSITAGNPTCKLNPDRQAESTFTLTNSNGADKLLGQIKVRPLGEAQSSWFTIGDQPERTTQIEQEFKQGTHQVRVKINVPPKVAPGKYSFRIDAISSDHPDDDYTEGQTVTIEVPEAATVSPPPSRWPWIALAAAVVVAVAGVGAFIALKPKPTVPAGLAGVSYEQAASAVTAAGLVPARKDQPTNSQPTNSVIAVTPNSGEHVDKGATVTLTVATSQAPPPPQPPVIVEISNPMVEVTTPQNKKEMVALDYCLNWAANCGKPAADAYCKSHNYAASQSLDKKDNDPTTAVISTGQMCTAPNCTRIVAVRCVKRPVLMFNPNLILSPQARQLAH